MSDTETVSSGSNGAQEFDFDPDTLRTKYREERDKRIRTDGNEQYVEVKGDFSRYIDDPYVAPGFTRAPLNDAVDVVIIGGGFGGLLAGARLREAGIKGIRMIEKGGDFGAPGTGTAIPARNAISSRTSICRCSRRPATSRRRSTRSRRKSSRTRGASVRSSISIATRAFRRRSRRSPGARTNAAGSSRPTAATACARASSSCPTGL